MILEILENLFYLNCALGLSLVGMPLLLAWHALIGVKAETLMIGFGKTILKFKLSYIKVEVKAVPIMNWYLKHADEEEKPEPDLTSTDISQDADDFDPFTKMKDDTPKRKIGVILYHLALPIYFFLFSGLLVGFDVPLTVLWEFPATLVGLVTEGPYTMVWQPMGPLLDQGFLTFCGVVFAQLAAFHSFPFWGTSVHFIVKAVLSWVLPSSWKNVLWAYVNVSLGLTFSLMLLLLLGMFGIL